MQVAPISPLFCSSLGRRYITPGNIWHPTRPIPTLSSNLQSFLQSPDWQFAENRFFNTKFCAISDFWPSTQRMERDNVLIWCSPLSITSHFVGTSMRVNNITHLCSRQPHTGVLGLFGPPKHPQVWKESPRASCLRSPKSRKGVRKGVPYVVKTRETKIAGGQHPLRIGLLKAL